MSGIRLFLRSRLFVIAMAGVAFTLGPACEDTVVEQPPQQPGGGGAKKKAAPKGGPIDDPLAQVVRDEYKPVEDEATPEPDAAKILGEVSVSNLDSFARLVHPFAKETIKPNTLDKQIGDYFGLKQINGLDLKAPAHFIWLDGYKVPIVVLSIFTPDEVLTQLPPFVVDRQGNAYSFSLSVTKAVYFNFVGKNLVITTDWRQFPTAKDRIAELVETKNTALVSGSIDLKRLGNADEWAELVPLPAALETVREDIEGDLMVLLDSAQKVDIALESNGGVHKLKLDVSSTGPAGIGTLGTDAKPIAFDQLMARVPAGLTEKPREIIFQHVQHEPLDQTKLAGLMASDPLRVLAGGEVDTRLLAKADGDRSTAFSGASLTVTKGFDASSAWVTLAPIADKGAFDIATGARKSALSSMAPISELPALEALPDVNPVTIQLTEELALHNLELVRPGATDEELVSYGFVLAGNLAEKVAEIQTELTIVDQGKTIENVSKLLAGRPAGKPLIIYARDLAIVPEEQSAPLVFGVFANEGKLAIDAIIPQTQLLRF